MILMKVVQDDTMPVPGFEQRTFMCSACHDVERHLVFVRPGRESDTHPMPMHARPPISDRQSDNELMQPADTPPSVAPASAVQDERAAASGPVQARGCKDARSLEATSAAKDAQAAHSATLAPTLERRMTEVFPYSGLGGACAACAAPDAAGTHAATIVFEFVQGKPDARAASGSHTSTTSVSRFLVRSDSPYC
jgi:hypothetical protein